MVFNMASSMKVLKKRREGICFRLFIQESAPIAMSKLAYQISQSVCAKINELVNGSSAIPTMTDSIRETMIDDTLYTGSNVDLTTDDPGDICPECDRVPSLCVQNQAGTAYGFYTILADQ